MLLREEGGIVMAKIQSLIFVGEDSDVYLLSPKSITLLSLILLLWSFLWGSAPYFLIAML